MMHSRREFLELLLKTGAIAYIPKVFYSFAPAPTGGYILPVNILPVGL